jgi:translation initiation factor 1
MLPSLSHTHTHTHSHTCSLSLSLSHTHTNTRARRSGLYTPKKKDETKEEQNPFADASGAVNAEEDTLGAGTLGGKVHIRIQQRNGGKCITTVAGLSSKLELKKIQKAVKKEHCCNGKVLKDEETGQDVMHFEGDQREAVKSFLLKEGICDKDNVKVHGF